MLVSIFVVQSFSLVIYSFLSFSFYSFLLESKKKIMTCDIKFEREKIKKHVFILQKHLHVGLSTSIKNFLTIAITCNIYTSACECNFYFFFWWLRIPFKFVVRKGKFLHNKACYRFSCFIKFLRTLHIFQIENISFLFLNAVLGEIYMK